MKRISTLLLSAVMAFGAVGAAEAVDLKASGYFDFAFGHADVSFDRHAKGEDTFYAYQRVRPQFNFIASEHLQGVLAFEIGKMDWGRPNTAGTPGRGGGALDADGLNIKTRRAYLDWTIPGTDSSVRMGIQGLALPSATGFSNPVFNADVAALVSTTKVTDMIDVTAFWARPFDQRNPDGDGSTVPNSNNQADEMDMFGLVVPVKGQGWKVTPWGVFANVGNASGFYEYILPNDGLTTASIPRANRSDSTTAWWLGTGLEFQIIDNLSFATDVMYGKLNSVDLGFSSLPGNNDFEASGWWLDAALRYKIDNFGTAMLFGWYATGDGKNDGNELGRMPVVGVDNTSQFTTTGFGGSDFGIENAVSGSATGTWGIGVKMMDVSFIEKLSHTLTFAYYEGTNNKNSSFAQTNNLTTGFTNRGAFYNDKFYLTTQDSAFEVNFDHKYQIYENLAATLELGYVNLDMAKRGAGTATYPKRDVAPDDAWKAQLMLRYAF